VRAATDAVSDTARAVGEALGAEPELDPDWDGSGRGVVAAWDRVVQRGGTAVVVCPADVVRGVLAHLLGVPAARRERIAVAAGSLAGIEAWGDGRISVAFTNRT
jgi:broad specificity phosphatase PhoE